MNSKGEYDMARRKFECPVCKYKFLADPERMYEQGKVNVIKGTAKKPGAQDEYTIDMECPNCENEFEVKVEA
jgi:uncharacterized CHY-type Zn-finger protein